MLGMLAQQLGFSSLSCRLIRTEQQSVGGQVMPFKALGDGNKTGIMLAAAPVKFGVYPHFM